MTDMTELRRNDDGSYRVYLRDEYIGRVGRQHSKWKAVNGAQDWKGLFSTRGKAVAALVRRAPKAT